MQNYFQKFLKDNRNIIRRRIYLQQGKHLEETFSLQLSTNYLLNVCETFSPGKASSLISKAGKGHYSICNFSLSDKYLVTISYHIAILYISFTASQHIFLNSWLPIEGNVKHSIRIQISETHTYSSTLLLCVREELSA